MHAGIFKYQKIIPKYANLMVAICVCTRHIPPYTIIYRDRHMPIYHGICWDIRVSGFQIMSVVTLSDGNYEPLSRSARPLPADSGPGSNECDGSRAAGWAQRGRSRAHWIKIHEEPHKN